MPKRCVVGGCSNVSNKEKGVSLHIIPYFGDERNEARKRRKKWANFVKLKRARWQPMQYSIICSEHFKLEDFSRRFSHFEGQRFVGNVLKRDEFGICVFLTVMPLPAAGALHVSGREREEWYANLHFNLQLHLLRVMSK